MNKQLFNLQNTTNYNLFNFLEHNRDIDTKNLEIIEKSILKHGLKTPLMVTNDGYILDGQHRFIILQKHKKPIWYVVNNYSSINDVEIMNNDRNDWKTKDRIYSQSKLGDLDCKKILHLAKNWNDDFNFMTVVDAYNSTNKPSSRLIKNKNYKIDVALGDTVLNYCLKLSDVLDNTKQSKFVRALKKVIVKNKNFNIDNLIKNCYKKRLNIYNNEKDIVMEIVDVYNYFRKKDLIIE